VNYVEIFDLMRRSYELLKQNLLLFLPSLILTYLTPVALGIAALFIFVPVLVITGNSPNPILSLIGGGFIGGIILGILALVIFAVVVAGMSNLNKMVLLTGETSFDDFKIGVKRYFARILGGVIVLAVIYVIIFFIGVGAAIAMIFSVIKDFIGSEMLQEGGFPEIFEQGFPQIPGGLMLLKTIFKIFANFSGVALILLTIAALIFIFTLFWIPAAVIDDVGVFGALRRSVGFVKEHFYTTIGFIGLYLIAELFTGEIFGGGGGGGGGEGFGFGFAIAPSLEAIFNLLIITFFVLLLFAIYADRTGKLKPTKRSVSKAR
jgi:hypothetical protein